MKRRDFLRYLASIPVLGLATRAFGKAEVAKAPLIDNPYELPGGRDRWYGGYDERKFKVAEYLGTLRLLSLCEINFDSWEGGNKEVYDFAYPALQTGIRLTPESEVEVSLEQSLLIPDRYLHGPSEERLMKVGKATSGLDACAVGGVAEAGLDLRAFTGYGYTLGWKCLKVSHGAIDHNFPLVAQRLSEFLGGGWPPSCYLCGRQMQSGSPGGVWEGGKLVCVWCHDSRHEGMAPYEQA